MARERVEFVVLVERRPESGVEASATNSVPPSPCELAVRTRAGSSFVRNASSRDDETFVNAGTREVFVVERVAFVTVLDAGTSFPESREDVRPNVLVTRESFVRPGAFVGVEN
jgi:hypothetical protein